MNNRTPGIYIKASGKKMKQPRTVKKRIGYGKKNYNWNIEREKIRGQLNL